MVVRLRLHVSVRNRLHSGRPGTGRSMPRGHDLEGHLPRHRRHGRRHRARQDPQLLHPAQRLGVRLRPDGARLQRLGRLPVGAAGRAPLQAQQHGHDRVRSFWLRRARDGLHRGGAVPERLPVPGAGLQLRPADPGRVDHPAADRVHRPAQPSLPLDPEAHLGAAGPPGGAVGRQPPGQQLPRPLSQQRDQLSEAPGGAGVRRRSRSNAGRLRRGAPPLPHGLLHRAVGRGDPAAGPRGGERQVGDQSGDDGGHLQGGARVLPVDAARLHNGALPARARVAGPLARPADAPERAFLSLRTGGRWHAAV
mmetsp:Transcript_119039/g.370834  ORF Transcript_119039/g.370834 Transcript_119039/m.370834 type:complete len:308 (-) Transcript_119039:796-1719(-)